jgi:hypothetical protein
MNNPNDVAFRIARDLQKKPNVLSVDVIPASSTSQEPEIVVIVEDLDRQIFPPSTLQTRYVSVHNKSYYMDKWGSAWYTFWMIDYQKTKEYREKEDASVRRAKWITFFEWSFLVVGLTILAVLAIGAKYLLG